MDLRSTRCVQFYRDGQTLGDVEYETLDLPSEGTLKYGVESADGGSGGAEHSLSGYIELGADKIFVSANANEEAGFSDATWTLPIFKSVRR